ncbi:MAG: NnrS family protein [Magnetovibrionaceae bacterium]
MARVLDRGFRPFFLLTGASGVLLIPLWLAMVSGRLDLPTALDAGRWHAHEMTFGLIAAAMAGFLLTAVPNWTGKPPVRGLWLLVLAGLWLSGRLVLGLGGGLPLPVVLAVESGFWVVLLFLLFRQVKGAAPHHNYPVVASVAFLWAAAMADFSGLPGSEAGLQLYGLLVALIGGRIVPNFTRNWLRARGHDKLPAEADRWDAAALVLHAIAVVAYFFDPAFGAGFLVATAVAHGLRLARWCGLSTLSEPLLAVLHIAYAGLALGLAVLGLSHAGLIGLAETEALHLFVIAGLVLMVAAVITRATLGHAGRPLKADRVTMVIYGLILLGAGARVTAGLLPEYWMSLIAAAGLGWTLAFGLYLWRYGPLLLGVGQSNQS